MSWTSARASTRSSFSRSARLMVRAIEGDFLCVCQSRAVVVTHLTGEHLHLSTQPPECGAVHDTIPVALKGTSVRMFLLGMFSTFAVDTVHGERRQKNPLAFDCIEDLTLALVSGSRRHGGLRQSAILRAGSKRNVQSPNEKRHRQLLPVPYQILTIHGLSQVRWGSYTVTSRSLLALPA